MSFMTDYYDIKSFSKLEYIWKDLERGKDMTCFQTYSWYKMLNECYVPEDTNNYSSINYYSLDSPSFKSCSKRILK